MTTARTAAPSQGDVLDLDEEARLSALEDLQVLDTEPEERFDRLTRLARRLFDVDVALVTLLDRDRQWFKSADGFDDPETPRSTAICDTTIRQSATFVVEDLEADPRFDANPLVTGPRQIRFYAGHPLYAPGGQPVGALCVLDRRPRAFSQSERDSLRDLAAYVQQELIVREEYDRAAQVQRGLLPRQVPALSGYSIAGACTPARAVGGDFFDWHPVTGGIGFTVADVMGKGFSGAIMMASVRAVLRSGWSQDSASEAISAAQQVLDADLTETGTFVTIFHGRLCPEDGQVSYSDAGHGLTLVLRAGGAVERPTSSGMPLGAWPESTWDEGALLLAPGDLLISVSDGVLDLYDGTLLSLDRIADLVRGCGDAQEAVDRVMALAQGQDLVDDVTVLAVRRIDAEEQQ